MLMTTEDDRQQQQTKTVALSLAHVHGVYINIFAVEITTSSTVLVCCFLQLIKATPIPGLQGTMVAMPKSLCLAMPARPHPSINVYFSAIDV